MNIQKRLASAAIALAVVVILLGAYTRLTDAGLGCPDWPGCYGSLVIPQAAHAEQAALRYPDSPLEPHKARSEMVHRYFAGALGSVIVVLFVLGWRQGGRLRRLSGGLLMLVVGQAALGMWTVTLALHPLVVTMHLLGGFLLLTLLWLYRVELMNDAANRPVVCGQRLPWLGNLACGALLLQIALGGWTSSNYAAMACVELPVCQAGWRDQLEWGEAFHLPLGHASYEFGVLSKEARQTIQIAHRLGALATTLLVGTFAFGLIRHGAALRPVLRSLGILLLALLLVQIVLGLANIHLALPLVNALAHNLVAAHLLVLCVLSRRAISHLSILPLLSPNAIRSRS
ncbi:COX15/CtaA family protein [Aeromonas eucrenophila]|uniref:Heme A synthase n=1 Tax=Aeromonas eucrenophila TaxID=649 RepID=A0ABW0YEQ2_9GAMM|nr:COX15/CtaA family protein [Aeromonas eucrenophila]